MERGNTIAYLIMAGHLIIIGYLMTTASLFGKLAPRRKTVLDLVKAFDDLKS
jgi:hypothetical protein